jgi:hypothetical protein
MPRGVDQLTSELERQRQPRVAEIEVELLGMFLLDAFAAPAPDRAGQARRHVLGRPSALPTSRTAPRAR